MFDDVLKGAKASKKNKVEEIKPVAPETKDLEEITTSTPKKRKSTGKRTDPAYKQVGAYIRKDTHLQIQKLLLEQPHKDFSDLVQELLSDYLVKQSTN